MLFEVISATQHEIAYFFMMVLFFLTAFILQFKVAFGANFVEFNNVANSFVSLWRFTMKDDSQVNVVLDEVPLLGNCCILVYDWIM